MKEDLSNKDLLRRYLLDGATDGERRRVEERFIADDEAFEEMLAAEDELYVEYRQGHLDTRERGVFEQKFLRTPADRERAAFAGAFIEAAAEFAPGPKPAAAGAWQSIRAFFGSGALRFGMAAAVVLLLAGALFLFVRTPSIQNDLAGLRENSEAERRRAESLVAEKQREQQRNVDEQLVIEREKAARDEARIRELESERARLEKETGKEPGQPVARRPAATFATLILSPGMFTRNGGGAMSRIALSPGMQTLRIGLLLKKTDRYPAYDVVLSSIDSGNTIWSRSGLRASANGRLRLNIPAKSLMRTDYEITVTGITPGGEPEEIGKYYFSVNK